MTEDELIAVPLGDLVGDESQPRRVVRPGAQDALKQSMARLGRTVQYITVTRSEPGRYRVVSGHRRVQAAKELGWEWLPAVVVDSEITDDDRLLRQVAENSVRAPLRPHEICDAVSSLHPRVSPQDISAAAGVSLRTVYNYLTILQHPDLAEQLRSGRSLRAVLAEAVARREAAGRPSPRAAFRQVQQSARRVVDAWEQLDEEEQRELATLLAPLLEKLEFRSTPGTASAVR